jgi:hypothetical protein
MKFHILVKPERVLVGWYDGEGLGYSEQGQENTEPRDLRIRALRFTFKIVVLLLV